MRLRLTGGGAGRALIASAMLTTAGALAAPVVAVAQADPRTTLSAGVEDAGQAALHMTLIGHQPRPDSVVQPTSKFDFRLTNSDMAFRGHQLFQGNFDGYHVWDIADPRHPRLRASYACSGGQGDLSIYRNLLFLSVEETRGRVDCSGAGVKDTVSAERFRGVRIIDIRDLDHPTQVAAVQTCRGSHTNTLVVDPRDSSVVYIYVSGTAVVRSPNELAGCLSDTTGTDPNTSLFRIEVIRVQVDSPAQARIVSTPRVFIDSAGHLNGLWKGGAHGDGTQTTHRTDMCHDITVYPAIGLAAGACSGNGLLLDISDPVNPRRVAQVVDPNFAYWHSATFNNAGTSVVFTDEWGSGISPRCRVTDQPTWGADAVFTIADRKRLTLAGYYKMPAPQPDVKNCVAHNGSLIPVPGRDIEVQGWYQGGVSVFDFTDAAHPKEIAYFARGPLDSANLIVGGEWAAYWYNGEIYGSEIRRGLDVLALEPSEYLSANEIAAARSVHVALLNVQNQQPIVWPATTVVARAYLDQLTRAHALPAAELRRIGNALDRADGESGVLRRDGLLAAAARVEQRVHGSAESARLRALADVMRRAAVAPEAERAAILRTVQSLFDGMRTRDSAATVGAFDSIGTVMSAGDGPTPGGVRAATQFAATLAHGTGGAVVERIFDPEVRIDGAVAQVWGYFTVHHGQTFLQCGQDAFTLANEDGVWKITQVVFSRRTVGCTHRELAP